MISLQHKNIQETKIFNNCKDQSPTKINSEGQNIIRIYYNPKPSIRVTLKFNKDQIAHKSLEQIIYLVINILRQDYLLIMSGKPSEYSMFPANKTGSKKSGKPELEKQALIGSLSFKGLFLDSSQKRSIISVLSHENCLAKNQKSKKVEQETLCCFFIKK